MTCPKCQAEFAMPAGADMSGGRPSVCPICGVRVLRRVTGVVRTSAVLISTRDEDAFYESMQDVPEDLRTQLFESTTSDNSGTIVIADRGGRERLTQVLARRENRVRNRREAGRTSVAPAPDIAGDATLEAGPSRGRSWIPWLAGLVILMVAALISAWFGLRW